MKYKDFTTRLTTRHENNHDQQMSGREYEAVSIIDMQGRVGGYVFIAEEWGLYLTLLYA